jgi:uncharacterized protein
MGVVVGGISSYFTIFVTMRVKDEIKPRSEEFLSLCKNHQIKFLYAFGSSTKQGFDETNSDIDFYVEVDATDPLTLGETLIDLCDKLELFLEERWIY